LGIELWIDDFGAGHANLGYLQRLSCHAVKIDRSFLLHHNKRRQLLGGMIALAQACGLRVAVEGIETVEDNELLQELGCDLLQGFLLGAPMSAEKLRASFADASMDRVHAL
jgi:EAL domain-containing protein (putative c-di-GMP-specific phosphodiesterase class I)